MTRQYSDGFTTHLRIKAQQGISTVVDNTTMSVGFNKRVATRNIATSPMLELILHIASVRIVHRVMELILSRHRNQFIRMSANQATLGDRGEKYHTDKEGKDLKKMVRTKCILNKLKVIRQNFTYHGLHGFSLRASRWLMSRRCWGFLLYTLKTWTNPHANDTHGPLSHWPS